MGEGMLPYRGGGLPVVGGGCLITRRASSVTTQSIALKYVMDAESSGTPDI